MTTRSDHPHRRNLRREVVVDNREILPGEKIMAEQLTIAPVPNGSVPEGAFRKLEQVVGRLSITPIGMRQTITNTKLAPSEVGAGFSAVIPEGYRSMTIKVEGVSASGWIMPDSFVDVVAIIVPLSQQAVEGKGRPISKIVLQNIKVLGWQEIEYMENQREPRSVSIVTLQVKTEQAEKLVLAENKGKLQVVMRKYGEQ